MFRDFKKHIKQTTRDTVSDTSTVQVVVTESTRRRKHQLTKLKKPLIESDEVR